MAGVGIEPKPGMTITKEEAEWYLQKTIIQFAKQIDPMITAPINENERGAANSNDGKADGSISFAPAPAGSCDLWRDA